MFTIDRTYHVTHVVDDIDATTDWYDDVFSPLVLTERSDGPQGVALTLNLVDDIVMMPMSSTPGHDSAPGRFHARFGEHMHSLAWYVDGLPSLVDTLQAEGLSLADQYGRPTQVASPEVWTRARQAPALLEFVESPRSTTNDPRFGRGWSTAASRDSHPLGIERTACLTIVTDDCQQATAFFRSCMAGRVVHEVEHTVHGTRSTMVQIGDETVVELAQPVDRDSRAARDLGRVGGMLHAVTFQVADLRRAADHLAGRGLRLEQPAEGHLVVDPEDAHGALFRFTDRPVTTW